MSAERRPGRSRTLLTAAGRIYGRPPGRDAPELERLRWLRSLLLKNDVIGLLSFALCAVFIRATIVYVIGGVWAVWALAILARMHVRMRRASS
jgi:hypothetical protein